MKRSFGVRLVALVCVVLQLYVLETASFIPDFDCRTCSNSCSFGRRFEACRCDGDCELYGDCCADRNTTCPTSDVFAELARSKYDYECRSVTPFAGRDRYIWMVGTCPEGFADLGLNEDRLVQNCISDSGDLALPVTDQSTGAVFKNEYCATCNGIADYKSWSYDLTCSAVLREVLANNSDVITQDDLDKYCSIVSYVPPTGLSVPDARDCFPAIAKCPAIQLPGLDLENTDLPYNTIAERCESDPQNLIGFLFDFSLAYQNIFCALCAHGIPDISCFFPIRPSRPLGERFPFTIILDVNGGGLIPGSTEVITTTVTVTCADSQVYDFTSNQCRDTICLDGVATLTGRKCSSECDGSLIELNETEYQYIGNDSILFANQVLEIEFNTSRGFPVVCVNFTENGTESVNTTITIYRYPDAYFILTYIGCSLSVIACVLLLVTYGLFKELRTLPSIIIINLAVAIIIGNLLILLGGPITAAFPTIELCASIAILLQYFFLSQFSWMSIMSFEMTRTFYQAFKLRKTESKHFKRNLLITYLVIGWSIPLIITVLTIIVNYTTDGLVFYGVQEDGTLGSCWINHLESSVIAFIVPLAVSLLFNLVTFIITTTFICIASRSKAKLHKNKNIPYVRLILAVFSISGLTWLFGLLAILSSSVWGWYPFIILNTTQGLLIFIVFLTTKRVFMLYLGIFGIRSKAFVDVKKISDTKQSVINIELEQANFRTDHLKTKTQLR